jgi:hypothetical protein
MAADERVWLKHKETGGLFPCPADAVDGWKELGWEPTDERPVFINPVTVEMPASAFEPRGGDFPKTAAALAEKAPTKAAKKAASTEGSD